MEGSSSPVDAAPTRVALRLRTRRRVVMDLSPLFRLKVIYSKQSVVNTYGLPVPADPSSQGSTVPGGLSGASLRAVPHLFIEHPAQRVALRVSTCSVSMNSTAFLVVICNVSHKNPLNLVSTPGRGLQKIRIARSGLQMVVCVIRARRGSADRHRRHLRLRKLVQLFTGDVACPQTVYPRTSALFLFCLHVRFSTLHIIPTPASSAYAPSQMVGAFLACSPWH